MPSKKKPREKPSPKAVRQSLHKPNVCAKVALDEPSERLATPEELAAVQPDEWEQYKRAPGGAPHSGSAFAADPYAEFGGSVSGIPPAYVPGSAVAKYSQRVQDLPRPRGVRMIHWRVSDFLMRSINRSLYFFASKPRLGIVAEAAQAMKYGMRCSFERGLQNNALARLRAAVNLDCGTENPGRNEALVLQLLAILPSDSAAIEQMAELQWLPISWLSFGARLLAFDDIAARHWQSAKLVLQLAECQVASTLDALRTAGVSMPEVAQQATLRKLLKTLYSDAEFCSYLANRPALSLEEFNSQLDAVIDRHLPGIVWSGLNKNGQPIPEAERAELFESQAAS